LIDVVRNKDLFSNPWEPDAQTMTVFQNRGGVA